MSPNPTSSPFESSPGNKSSGGFDLSYEERRRALSSPWITRLRSTTPNLPPPGMRRGGQFKSPAAKQHYLDQRKPFFLQRKACLRGVRLSLFFQVPCISDSSCPRENRVLGTPAQHTYKEISENQIRIRLPGTKCLSSPVFYSHLLGIINGSSSRNAHTTISSLQHVARSRDAVYHGADDSPASRNLSDRHVLENNIAHQLKRKAPVCMNETEKHILFRNMKRSMGTNTISSDCTAVAFIMKDEGW